ncbi:hypothetical protein GG804_19140 [Sphingomonas histidinilytica]|uniref:hypothetical protein n=1 Tax=Rhizorhabdus histidinilytica TaxID=439228 RepID=UPI001ADD4ECF|nr:hypothetical protein [Rhizorhabdus histidinilytica]MBO9378886.1 hypothetical protein [Rhizorhabdus histidinilytica]
MRRLIAVGSGALFLVTACSRSEENQSGDNLRSDLPVQTIEYLMAHPKDAEAVRTMCSEWKSSQRPIASWPASVTQNCNNDDTVKMLKIEDERREKLKRQAGI